ncbi:hypothetical protein Bca101_049666 [Brassica carinata]
MGFWVIVVVQSLVYRLYGGRIGSQPSKFFFVFGSINSHSFFRCGGGNSPNEKM